MEIYGRGGAEYFDKLLSVDKIQEADIVAMSGESAWMSVLGAGIPVAITQEEVLETERAIKAEQETVLKSVSNLYMDGVVW